MAEGRQLHCMKIKSCLYVVSTERRYNEKKGGNVCKEGFVTHSSITQMSRRNNVLSLTDQISCSAERQGAAAQPASEGLAVIGVAEHDDGGDAIRDAGGELFGRVVD